MTSSGANCPDDLIVLAQRGPLSQVDRGALDQHLRGCAICRAAVAVESALSAAPEALPGDENIVARVVDRTLDRARTGARRRTIRSFQVTAAAAASVLLVGGVAVGGILLVRPDLLGFTRARSQPMSSEKNVVRRSRSARAKVEIPAIVPPSETLNAADPPGPPAEQALPALSPVGARPSARPSDGLERSRSITGRDTPSLLVEEAAPPAPAAPAAARELAARELAALPPVAVAPTADDLLRKANRARAEGDTVAAIAFYQALQSRFAGSREALVSYVSLGQELLSAGRGRDAAAMFATYLEQAGSAAPLAEEALYGRAQALRDASDRAGERAAWEALLQRFPASIHREHASQRLRTIR